MPKQSLIVNTVVNKYDTTEEMDENIIISRDQRSATFKAPSLVKLDSKKEEQISFFGKIT